MEEGLTKDVMNVEEIVRLANLKTITYSYI